MRDVTRCVGVLGAAAASGHSQSAQANQSQRGGLGNAQGVSADLEDVAEHAGIGAIKRDLACSKQGLVCREIGSDACKVRPVGLDRCRACLLYTSPSPRDLSTSRMPSSA